jgi:hypothetical protein
MHQGHQFVALHGQLTAAGFDCAGRTLCVSLNSTSQAPDNLGKKWWAWQGLNLRPLRCQETAPMPA